MSAFVVRFWGVRGSIACPSPSHARYGGNTSCVQLDLGGTQVILDAGTGMRGLGRRLLGRGERDASLLLTHVHWDHTAGLPFFRPLYSEACAMRVFACGLQSLGGVREVLSGQMAAPNFPVPLSALRARLEFQDLVAGDAFALSPTVWVRTAGLNHPDGATGYRVEHAGRALCYVTDTEHTPGEPDEQVLSLIEGADLVIYDSTYTDAELPAHVGWGHSTWQEGIRLCRRASAKRLALFHHDPDHDDAFMDQVEADARAIWPAAFAAREGMQLEV
jgi:phosphoribosyl 1,2-cyclic phosphodiesterase